MSSNESVEAEKISAGNGGVFHLISQSGDHPSIPWRFSDVDVTGICLPGAKRSKRGGFLGWEKKIAHHGAYYRDCLTLGKMSHLWVRVRDPISILFPAAEDQRNVGRNKKSVGVISIESSLRRFTRIYWVWLSLTTITIGKGLPLVEREDWRPQALGNSLGALTYCGLFIGYLPLLGSIITHYYIYDPSWEAHSQPYLHKVWPQNPPKPHGLPKVPQRYSKGLARWDVKTTNLGPCWFSRWQRASAGGNKHQIDRKDWKQMGKQKQQAEPTSLKSFDIYSEILFIMLVHKYIYI